MKNTKLLYTREKYKKIVSLIKNHKLNNFQKITNFGLLAGDAAIFKVLTIFDLIKKTKNIKGDIIEFGVWNGNTGILIKKILDIFKIKKKVYLFDHFKGMLPEQYKKIDRPGKKFANTLKGNLKLLKQIINFFKLKNIFIINKDANTLNKKYFKGKNFSMIIIDVDLYEPTKFILESTHKYLSKGGIIIFDEGNQKEWPGEKKAMNEFLKKNKSCFRKKFIKYGRQPDVFLEKIK